MNILPTALLHDRRSTVLSRHSPRQCGFERLEPRQLLAADVALGNVALDGAADVSFGFTGGLTGSISGSVFTSHSADDCETHEAASNLAGVQIQLLDATGTVVQEGITDEQGAYQFDDLIPGEYAVRQLPTQGYVEGASHVGEGGGIALDMNLVGGIAVHAGMSLEGYDFCDFLGSPEPAGPSDRPIVPHEVDAAISSLNLSIVSLSLQQRAPVATATQREQFVPVVVESSFVSEKSQPVSRTVEQYGGSSRALDEYDGIRAWDEYPADGLFSTASYLELASTRLPTVEELVSKLDELDRGDDAAFADGYTSKSLAWCEDGDCVELEQLVGDSLLSEAEAAHSDGERAAVADTATPKVARLRRDRAAR